MSPASAGAPAAQVRQNLLDLLTPLVSAAGYDLEDITVSSAGRRSLVRIVVDRDGGIDLDAVATVSRVVAECLDVETEPAGSLGQALAGTYVLEVTSPGVDRPLREPRHWRRAAGRLVTAQVAGRTVTGRIGAVDDDGVTLQVKGRDQRVGWQELGPGKVQVEFNRSATEQE